MAEKPMFPNKTLIMSVYWVLLTLFLALLGELLLAKALGGLFGNTKDSSKDIFSPQVLFHFNMLLSSAAFAEHCFFRASYPKKKSAPTAVIAALLILLGATATVSHSCSLKELEGEKIRAKIDQCSSHIESSAYRLYYAFFEERLPPFKNYSLGFLIIGSALAVSVRNNCQHGSETKKLPTTRRTRV